MSWRMRVRHTTGYRYDSEVTASYNEARLIPQTGLDQLTLESTITTTPPTRQQRYWDYWGTQVTSFDVHIPHTELEVEAISVIDTGDAQKIPDEATWDLLRSDRVRDRWIEVLVPSVKTVPDDTLKELAIELVAGRSPYEAALKILETVHERVAYKPGSTGVSTSANEAWGAAGGGLPGHRPRQPGAPAQRRDPGALRERLPAPRRRAGAGRRDRHRRVPRLGRGVARQLVGLRPDQRRAGR